MREREMILIFYVALDWATMFKELFQDKPLHFLRAVQVINWPGIVATHAQATPQQVKWQHITTLRLHLSSNTEMLTFVQLPYSKRLNSVQNVAQQRRKIRIRKSGVGRRKARVQHVAMQKEINLTYKLSKSSYAEMLLFYQYFYYVKLKFGYLGGLITILHAPKTSQQVSSKIGVIIYPSSSITPC